VSDDSTFHTKDIICMIVYSKEKVVMRLVNPAIDPIGSIKTHIRSRGLMSVNDFLTHIGSTALEKWRSRAR
jgi:hypothetical protein